MNQFSGWPPNKGELMGQSFPGGFFWSNADGGALVHAEQHSLGSEAPRPLRVRPGG